MEHCFLLWLPQREVISLHWTDKATIGLTQPGSVGGAGSSWLQLPKTDNYVRLVLCGGIIVVGEFAHTQKLLSAKKPSTVSTLLEMC